MQCARHPSVETELACGKCGTPICPRCSYQTPVGARCRTCAGIRRLPTYNISAVYLARGAAGALLAGAALGAVWGLVLPFGLFGFFGLLVGIGVGYGVGEAVSVATNRKAGPPLQVIGALGVVFAYIVRGAVLASAFRGVSLGDVLVGDIFGYIVVVIGIFVAAGRLR